MPFSFVQLQPCGIPPAHRYAQAKALALPGVYIATAVDLLDPSAPGAKPCPFPGEQKPTCANPNGMCHTRWQEQISSWLAAVTARAIFSPSALAAAAARLPPLSPSVGKLLSIKLVHYRTHDITLQLEFAGTQDPHFTSIGVNGTKESSLCCNSLAVGVEFARLRRAGRTLAGAGDQAARRAAGLQRGERHAAAADGDRAAAEAGGDPARVARRAAVHAVRHDGQGGRRCRWRRSTSRWWRSRIETRTQHTRRAEGANLFTKLRDGSSPPGCR